MVCTLLDDAEKADFETLVPGSKSSDIELCIVPDMSETVFFSELGLNADSTRYPLPPGSEDLLEYEMDDDWHYW